MSDMEIEKRTTSEDTINRYTIKKKKHIPGEKYFHKDGAGTMRSKKSMGALMRRHKGKRYNNISFLTATTNETTIHIKMRDRIYGIPTRHGLEWKRR